MRAAVLAAAMVAATHATGAGLEEDFRCLKSVDTSKPIHMEFRQVGNSDVNWSAGYVLYKDSRQAIPIALAKTEVTDRPPGRPWEFESTWLELVGGKVSGTYVMVHQGANVYSLTYRPAKGGKAVEFVDDNDHTGKQSCAW